MSGMEMVVWDVNHGNAIWIQTPNGKDVLLDCGCNDTTGFSPAIYLENRGRTIDYLIISHPHTDHIQDIENVIYYNKPSMLHGPEIDLDKMLEANPEGDEELIRSYYDFQKTYNSPVSDDDNPEYESWGGGLSFHNFEPNRDDSNINNLGVVTFINYGGFTMLCPGDIEERGWERLLNQSDFVNWLRKTNFLIAPHHGRKAGFDNEIFEYFTPKLTIVSDGRFGDTSATDRYSKITDGWSVKKRDSGDERKRYVVTTRNDGPININVSVSDKTYVNITID